MKRIATSVFAVLAIGGVVSCGALPEDGGEVDPAGDTGWTGEEPPGIPPELDGDVEMDLDPYTCRFSRGGGLQVHNAKVTATYPSGRARRISALVTWTNPAGHFNGFNAYFRSPAARGYYKPGVFAPWGTPKSGACRGRRLSMCCSDKATTPASRQFSLRVQDGTTTRFAGESPRPLVSRCFDTPC